MANVAKTVKKDIKKAKKETKKVSDEQILRFLKDIDMLKEQIIDLENKLDDSYKEQEEMLAEVDKFVYSCDDGFMSIEKALGEITYNDVMYHLEFFQRVMKHKFGYKPKSEDI